MRIKIREAPSAAMAVAAVALCFGLAGSALAGTNAAKRAVTKSQVKSISKKQANKAIDKQAPGLSVSHATSADTAANGALGYAHVTRVGTVTASLSLNVTSANVSHPIVGVYCFSGLPFTPHTVTGTVDSGDGPGVVQASVQPASFGNCPPSAIAELRTYEPDTTDLGDFDDGFYVIFN